jgi:HSP20 family protein
MDEAALIGRRQGRLSMTLIRPRIGTEMPTLREAIDRLFDDSFVSPRGWASIERVGRPPIDAYATPEALVVKVAMPGVKPEEIRTTVTGDVLTVEGTYRDDAKREDEGYVVRELHRGSFHRSMSLPADLKTDAAQAVYADGILTLTFPKAEEAKPREIKVKAA